jgi:ribonuclease P protein component
MPRRGPTAFPKAARVRRRGEFLAIQERGQRMRLRSFVVLRLASPQGRTRLGITVSRRVGNAVVRNRVKRMVREVFRTIGCHPTPAQDILVIARAGAHELEYSEVAAELESVFRASRTAT